MWVYRFLLNLAGQVLVPLGFVDAYNMFTNVFTAPGH